MLTRFPNGRWLHFSHSCCQNLCAIKKNTHKNISSCLPASMAQFIIHHDPDNIFNLEEMSYLIRLIRPFRARLYRVGIWKLSLLSQRVFKSPLLLGGYTCSVPMYLRETTGCLSSLFACLFTYLIKKKTLRFLDKHCCASVIQNFMRILWLL